ncbi:MAG: argininosuccinate lyase [Pseudomonadota bacterium]
MASNDSPNGLQGAGNARPDSGAKLWGGRFSEATDAFVQEFTASVGFDRRLATHDLTGSIAHANMLAQVGILTASERTAIVDGLTTIGAEIEAGEFAWQVALEDVHMNIESRLIELIGDTGKKLHTGRSRNDQVATDIRLFLREEIDQLTAQMDELQRALLDQAERHADTIMPGFTHLQSAQPVTFGHHLLAWFEMLSRDRARLTECRARVNRLPLGAAALAGTTFPIDRTLTAQELGFDGLCENSLDAVSDRDFAIEFCAAASLAMVHFSRWCEELVLWSSQQFDFVTLPDRFCTGSSIMPQKKNPDVPELIRGKTGRAVGHLMSLLTLMKSQPLAYNKDNQEDKEPLFDAVDTLSQSLTALRGLIPALTAKSERMREAAADGYATATDLADYLVRAGVAFRDAHHVVGRAVGLAIASARELHELTLEELRGLNPMIDEDVYAVLRLEGSVQARSHTGGTAPAQVRKAVEEARRRLAAAAGA